MNKRRSTGFTIVELLIVIVVIAILAAISIVAYTGIQQRARDAERLSDAQMIDKAIKSYYAVHGEYPPGGRSGGFERSTDTSEMFLEHLINSGFLPDSPLDPINDSGHFYAYYLYPVGATYGGGPNGCDDSRGAYYVLYVNRFETTSGKHPSSPGFSCSNRNWETTNPMTTQWVTGGYTN